MSSPYLSEIRILSFNYAPKGWALCNGQLLPINQNAALFSLLGTTYGGNGQTTFALPNLQGRVPIHLGNGYSLGQAAGTLAETINTQTMAAHNHAMMGDATTDATLPTPAPAGTRVLGKSFGSGVPAASFTVSMYSSQGVAATLNPLVITNTGGSQAHTNQQPFLTLNMSIALQGIFPSQN